MKCCCCTSELTITHQDYYFNYEYPFFGENTLRDGYQCINHECVANALNIVWTSDGSIHLISNQYLTKAMVQTMIELSSNGIPYPYGSQRFYEEKFKQIQKKMAVNIEVKGFRFSLEPGVSSETPIEKKFEKITWFRPSFAIYDIRKEFEIPVNAPWIDFKKRYLAIKNLLKKTQIRSQTTLDINLPLTRTLARIVFPRYMEDLTWGEKLGTYAFRYMNQKISKELYIISLDLKEKESQNVVQ